MHSYREPQVTPWSNLRREALDSVAGAHCLAPKALRKSMASIPTPCHTFLAQSKVEKMVKSATPYRKIIRTVSSNTSRGLQRASQDQISTVKRLLGKYTRRTSASVPPERRSRMKLRHTLRPFQHPLLTSQWSSTSYFLDRWRRQKESTTWVIRFTLLNANQDPKSTNQSLSSLSPESLKSSSIRAKAKRIGNLRRPENPIQAAMISEKAKDTVVNQTSSTNLLHQEENIKLLKRHSPRYHARERSLSQELAPTTPNWTSSRFLTAGNVDAELSFISIPS